MNCITRQKDMTRKEESPRAEGVQYATGEEQEQLLTAPERMQQLGQSRNNAQFWMHLVMKVKSKEQYCIGTCNVRSVNQGKLDVVKQQLPRVNTNILGIGELKWTEIVNLMQMTIISTVGKNPIEEME